MSNREIKNINSKSQKQQHQNDGESLTKQHFAKEADINNKVQRFIKTGVFGTPGAQRQPIYGNFDSLEYMDMRNAIADIGQEFASLPARIRGRFQNDPYQMIRWLDNPANQQEAQRLGLIPSPPQANANEPPASGGEAAPSPLPLKETVTPPPQGGLPKGDQ